ncbi:ABC transporter permease [Paenibacillus validus]|uniref:ABC transporter permease n=1 Tax=Paenibacillus TaxID=44249 RepID=UPI001F3F0333|nr:MULTISPECIES: ABC transporter permease [Paenibacillus]MED4602045.1 ABC transporter permease [Paenibacillus validus]MED4607591.1 ABC transporter permease [Paenibacillus validus]
MHLLSLVRNEHMKIFSRFRTWSFMVLLVLLTLLPLFLQNKAPQEGNWQTQLEQENIQLQKTVGDPEMPQSEVQSLRNKIMVNEYRIAHSIKPYNSVWGTVNELSVYIAVVTFFTVIVTSDAVAGEFSAGTIKMLLTRPVSRSKVLLSKYLASFCFGLILLCLLFAASFIIGSIAHGFEGVSDPYLYVKDGAVHEGSMVLHSMSTYGLKSVNLLMLVTLAFMISAVFRSVNMAVAISILLLFTGNLIVFVLSKFEWVKYVLFANTDLTKYLDGGVPMEGMSMNFSLAVLAAYFVLFNAVSWTVFAKRDVAA